VRQFLKFAACIALAGAPSACGQLSGLDGFTTSNAGITDGQATRPEGGPDAALPDASVNADATAGSDVGAGGDVAVSGDASVAVDAAVAVDDAGDGEGDDATGTDDAPAGPDATDASEEAEAGCASTAPTLCGSTCVDEQTDVDNCHGCGNACPGVSNGQPACVSGACTFTCSSGYSPCGGACVTLTTTANCGACGNACSGGTPVCLGSGSSYSCSGTFGGIYSDVDTSACSAIAQTCNTGVYLGNPLDSNACGCPSGYSTSTAMNLMNDQAGGNCGNGIWGWASMHVCYAGASSTLTSANDFGGFYQTIASNCATPAPSQTCEVGNPLVSGGGCSCPAGTGWKTITMKVDGTNWGQGTINFCWSSSAPLTTFGGAYEGTDPGTGYGGATSTAGGCLVGNPAVNGSCNCPTGTTAVSVRSIYGTPQYGCGDSAQDGSHVFVCVK